MKLKVDMDDDGVDDLEISVPSVIVKGKVLKVVLMAIASITAMVGATQIL